LEGGPAITTKPVADERTASNPLAMAVAIGTAEVPTRAEDVKAPIKEGTETAGFGLTDTVPVPTPTPAWAVIMLESKREDEKEVEIALIKSGDFIPKILAAGKKV
jgi:hypothetical protein